MSLVLPDDPFLTSKFVASCNPSGGWVVKSVRGTPVQCVDHLVPLCSGTFSFSVLGVGAE